MSMLSIEVTKTDDGVHLTVDTDGQIEADRLLSPVDEFLIGGVLSGIDRIVGTGDTTGPCERWIAGARS